MLWQFLKTDVDSTETGVSVFFRIDISKIDNEGPIYDTLQLAMIRDNESLIDYHQLIRSNMACEFWNVESSKAVSLAQQTVGSHHTLIGLRVCASGRAAICRGCRWARCQDNMFCQDTHKFTIHAFNNMTSSPFQQPLSRFPVLSSFRRCNRGLTTLQSALRVSDFLLPANCPGLLRWRLTTARAQSRW